MADLKEKNKEQNSIDNVTETKNALSFDDRVFKKIAGFAASEIPGILAMSGNLISGITDKLKNADDPTKGITIEAGKKQVAVDMKIICEYGRNIPNIYMDIVNKISSSIKEMTGLDVVEVNVHVADILAKEDFDRKKKADFKSDANAEAPLKEGTRRLE